MDPPILGDFPQLVTSFRRQLQFYLRTWRFVGLLLFVGIVSIVVFAVQLYFGASRITEGSDAAQYLSGYLSNIGTTVILVAAFLGGDAIAMDFGGATGYFMLVQPVRRVVLLLGRFAAAVVAAAVIGLTYVVIALLATSYFFGAGSIPWAGVAVALGLLVLFLLGAVAVAFFFSSFFKSPAISIILTVLILWLGFSIVTGVLEVAGIEPWFSLLYAGDGVALALLPSYPHAQVSRDGFGGSFEPYLWESAVISVAYLVVFLFLSVVLYNLKESKG